MDIFLSVMHAIILLIIASVILIYGIAAGYTAFSEKQKWRRFYGGLFLAIPLATIADIMQMNNAWQLLLIYSISFIASQKVAEKSLEKQTQ